MPSGPWNRKQWNVYHQSLTSVFTFARRREKRIMNSKGKTLGLIALTLFMLSLPLTSALATGWEWPPLGDPGNITVVKFNALNGDGVRDPGEPSVPDWPFQIWRYYGTGLYKVAEGTTGPEGTVTFSSLAAPTRYKVWEPEQDCWQPTTSTGTYWIGGYYMLAWTVSGQTTMVSFGNQYT